MNLVCPQCTAVEARSLSLIHREHAASFGPAARRRAAPPARRPVFGWLIVVAAAVLLCVRSLEASGALAGLCAGVAVLGVWLARANRSFNAAELPYLYARWQQSFMCGRCGAVFHAADVSAAADVTRVADAPA